MGLGGPDTKTIACVVLRFAEIDPATTGANCIKAMASAKRFGEVRKFLSAGTAVQIIQPQRVDKNPNVSIVSVLSFQLADGIRISRIVDQSCCGCLCSRCDPLLHACPGLTKYQPVFDA